MRFGGCVINEHFVTDRLPESDLSGGIERALLVHQSGKGRVLDSDFDELSGLAISAGANVVGCLSASRPHPDPSSFVGRGKVQEIAERVIDTGADLVIFNQAITPVQERNLERLCKCRIVDRTRLILDIFAMRARTHEGKLQVELAQLRHLSTRLVRGWTHLERQRGGIGLRGPGETQLETDRRLLGARIRYLQNRLSKVRSQRHLRRNRRARSRVPTIAIVGYTNAGKSSLFNRLVNEDVFCADQLFATLDPTMRRLQIKGFGPAILSDTVGFIQGLPHTLVDAFMSTLEEVSNADLLLRVADDSDPEVMTHESEVEAVLVEISAAEIPTIVVRNKCDLSGKSPAQRKAAPNGRTLVRVSAQTGLGIETLLEEIFIELSKFSREVSFSIPPSEGRLRAQIFSLTEVLEESVDQDGISHIRARADAATIGKIKRDPDYCPEFLDSEQKQNGDDQRCEGGEDVSFYSTMINSH